MAQARSGRSEPLTRNEVVEAARRLLDVMEVGDLSLRKLAAELGVTAPALYAHVKDKRDLLRAVAEQGFAELGASFDAVRGEDPAERLVAYGRAYVGKAIGDPEVFKVMFLFRPALVPVSGIDNELEAASAALDQPMVTVQEAMAVGVIHPDRDLVLTVMTLWTTAHGLASVLLLGSRGGVVVLPDNAEALIDHVLRVNLTGLALPPEPAPGGQAGGA
jgi:AcrR family transcriptional regulator